MSASGKATGPYWKRFAITRSARRTRPTPSGCWSRPSESPCATYRDGQAPDWWSAKKPWFAQLRGAAAVVDLVGEAVALQRFLETLHWRGGEEAYVDELLRSYAPRIQDARDFALSRRVLLLQSAAGIGIDLSL